jgi:cell division protein FtsB
MSAIVKTRRRKNLPASTAALWLVLGLAAVFFVVSYGQELLLAQQLNEQAAAQRQANEVLQDENTRLQALLQYYGSDKYVEQRAREDLNLRRPDEEVLIPVEAAPHQDESGDTLADEPEATPTPALEQANWQKWFDLFRATP